MKFNKLFCILLIVAMIVPSVFAVGEVVSARQGQVVNAFEGMGVSATEVRAIFKEEFAVAKGEFIKDVADNIVDFKQYGIQLLEAFRLTLRNFVVIMLSGVIALFTFVYGIMFYLRMKKEAKLFIKLEEHLKSIEKMLKEKGIQPQEAQEEQKPKYPAEKKKTFQKPLLKALKEAEAVEEVKEAEKVAEPEKPKKEKKHWFKKTKPEANKDVASLTGTNVEETKGEEAQSITTP